MNEQLIRILNLIIWLVLLVSGALAQSRPPRNGPPTGFEPPGGIGQRPGPPYAPGPGGNPFWAELGEGRLVKGAPFSAQAVIESTQTLGDGTRISHKTNATVYRDSEGRTRREVTLNINGPFIVEGEAPRLIFISDPVTRTIYVLQPNQRTVRKMRAPIPAGPPPYRPPPEGQGKRETLGKQTIEGLEAEGTRTVITIPVGQIGNDRPIEIVGERWEATALQTPILSKHKDPRVGETISRLTNINRGEPVKTLFEVPADYTLIEDPFPGDRRGGPPNGTLQQRGGKRPPNW